MTQEQIKAQADKLLRASGFEDIESPNGMLKESEPRQIRARGDEYFELCMEFYRARWRRFLSSKDRAMWKLFCSGLNYREIAGRVGLASHHVVADTIKHYRRDMRAWLTSRDETAADAEDIAAAIWAKPDVLAELGIKAGG